MEVAVSPRHEGFGLSDSLDPDDEFLGAERQLVLPAESWEVGGQLTAWLW